MLSGAPNVGAVAYTARERWDSICSQTDSMSWGVQRSERVGWCLKRMKRGDSDDGVDVEYKWDGEGANDGERQVGWGLSVDDNICNFTCTSLRITSTPRFPF